MLTSVTLRLVVILRISEVLFYDLVPGRERSGHDGAYGYTFRECRLLDFLSAIVILDVCHGC